MLNKLIQYFIPLHFLRNEEEHRKAKITVGALLVVAYFNINYIIISIIFEYAGGLYSQVPLLLCSAVCLFLFRAKFVPGLVHLIFFIVCIISIAITVYFTKGYESFITPWIASTPIVALLVAGKRGGLMSLIACSLVLTGFYYLYLNEYDFPEGYNLKYKNIFSFTTNLGLILILYLVAIVFENTKNTALRNLDYKNSLLEIKQKDITDSITYAKRIQEAILPNDKLVKKLLPDSFILYKPKDIVSGDFYWVSEWGDQVMFAAVDCTGHGVPGAFMSIVGQNMLNQAVNEHGLSKPNLVLNSLNKGVSRTLGKDEDNVIRDGMDLALCSLNRKTMTLECAGAYNPVWLLRGDDIIEIKGNKFPIGSFMDDAVQNFDNNMVSLKKGDQIYIFTDGYSDQFGGPKGKKFKEKNLKSLLLAVKNLSMDQQKEHLNEKIEEWRGDLEQIDDILIMGVRI
ncbi:MAG: hypothetical protein K0Q95_2294 [Bacteroidota bacterium]|jgi:serine phosphatase RsbU (regulator of sigma subunit)|nr:hypothetical protein [Bacteroidota bacterium]